MISSNSGADYEFQGAATGVFTTTNDPQVDNFIVNSLTGGNITLSKAMTVNGALTLRSGYLTTANNLLTIGNSGTSSTSNGSFVNGPLAKVINAAGVTFPFYVGTVTGGLRTISATTVTTSGAGSTTFTARFFSSNPQIAYAGATKPGTIQSMSACEYWTLDRSTGDTQYDAKVTPAANPLPVVFANVKAF